MIVRVEEESLVVVIVDDSLPFDLGIAPERDLDASLEKHGAQRGSACSWCTR